MMKTVEGGVTAARGFLAAGCAAGIKKAGRDDMAMVYSEKPCLLVGTFTSNRVKAAPVIWDRDIVKGSGIGQAVVVNAGIANACTGQQGLDYCRQTAEAASEALGIPADTVLVASTGVIGFQLPIDRITAGVRTLAGKLSHDLEAGTSAARAIMTTDTVKKEAAVQVTLTDGTVVTIGGMTKGSGMIHPNMCTMLCFVSTDAVISRDLMQKALLDVVKATFNMISVDGDTSTNDTCLLLANGLAGNKAIEEENEDYALFKAGLLDVCTRLAKIMAKDGEGATALVEMKVVGAPTKEVARTLARSVISSSLTKAAIYGHDANWGRILCAMGYSGADFEPEKVDLTFTSAAGSVKVLENGVGTGFSEELATKILGCDEIFITADLKLGSEEAEAWGCDLTHKYVDINADYRS